MRAPFPGRIAINEVRFNSIIETAIRSGALKPANGQWLQRKADALELRIRIVPDDINIDSFEENLTPAELERGRQFWQRVWKGDKPEDAWDELRSFFSTPRSAWVVRQTRPINFVDGGPLPAQPQFPEPPLRANSYTQAPVAAALPDFFTAILYRTGQPEHFVKGQLVSPDLATGFDPNEPDPTSFQPGEDGDLKFPESLRWIFNFDEAEKKGSGHPNSVERGRLCGWLRQAGGARRQGLCWKRGGKGTPGRPVSKPALSGKRDVRLAARHSDQQFRKRKIGVQLA